MPRQLSEAERAYDAHVEECKMCFLVDKGWRVGLNAIKHPAIRRCETGKALMKPIREQYRAEQRERHAAKFVLKTHEESIQAVSGTE